MTAQPPPDPRGWMPYGWPPPQPPAPPRRRVWPVLAGVGGTLVVLAAVIGVALVVGEGRDEAACRSATQALTDFGYRSSEATIGGWRPTVAAQLLDAVETDLRSAADRAQSTNLVEEFTGGADYFDELERALNAGQNARFARMLGEVQGVAGQVARTCRPVLADT